MYCGPSIASEVFLTFTIPDYTNFVVRFSLFALFSDQSEVFLPNYSQMAILHAAHFRRVVNDCCVIKTDTVIGGVLGDVTQFLLQRS